jgi:hypothetical protein
LELLVDLGEALVGVVRLGGEQLVQERVFVW